MDIPDETADRLFSEVLTSRRPALEDVVEIMDTAFNKMNINVGRVAIGPPTWIWEDLETQEIGFPRFYILSTSNSPGMEGYPIFTVRQAYSVRFDTWVTISSLIIGPDEMAIARSISLTMAHHAGAFAGMKHVVSTITANRNSPLAGLVAVQKLLEAPPTKVDFQTEEELTNKFDESEGPLELIEVDSDRKMVN